MNKEQAKSKIDKLLLYQRRNGASKSEEITCFKKALELALIYDIEDIDLDEVLRHIYKLEHYQEYSEAFQPDQFETKFEEETETESWKTKGYCSEDYDVNKNDFMFKDKYKRKSHNSFVKKIALGVCLGEILAWIFKKFASHIKANLAFVCIVLIPGVIAWAMEMVK